MQPIVIQQVKVAGWSPAPLKLPNAPSVLGQAPSAPSQSRRGLIESPLFNAGFDLLGVFAAGALAVGSLTTERRGGPLSSLPSRHAMGGSDKNQLFRGAGWAITFGVVSLALLAKASYEISKA